MTRQLLIRLCIRGLEAKMTQGTDYFREGQGQQTPSNPPKQGTIIDGQFNRED